MAEKTMWSDSMDLMLDVERGADASANWWAICGLREARALGVQDLLKAAMFRAIAEGFDVDLEIAQAREEIGL